MSDEFENTESGRKVLLGAVIAAAVAIIAGIVLLALEYNVFAPSGERHPGTMYTVVVLGQVGHEELPVHGAEVNIKAPGYPVLEDVTNGDGFASFSITPELLDQIGFISISSKGFESHSEYIQLTGNSSLPPIILKSSASPAMPTTTPTIPVENTNAPTPTDVVEPSPGATIPPIESPTVATAESELVAARFSAGTGLPVLLSDSDLVVQRQYVPAGTFEMGSWAGSFGEAPRHPVSVDAYWIDQHEVTNEQFAAFLNEIGNGNDIEGKYIDLEVYGVLIDKSRGYFAAKEGRKDYPVTDVSWNGAAAFCEWADGRLPTEAEWEYAARGPESNIFPWGNDSADCTLANFSPVGAAPCANGKVIVSDFQDGVSWVGASNMAGNVSEWVMDWYDLNYYSDVPQEGVENPLGPNIGTERVIRGGAWNSTVDQIYSYARQGAKPGIFNSDVGFRCVQDVEP